MVDLDTDTSRAEWVEKTVTLYCTSESTCPKEFKEIKKLK